MKYLTTGEMIPDGVPASPPSLTERLFILASAFAAHSRNDYRLVSGEPLEARQKKCQACEQLSEEGECLQCGCLVAIKTTWESEACPLGYWSALGSGSPGGGCGGCKKDLAQAVTDLPDERVKKP